MEQKRNRPQSIDILAVLRGEIIELEFENHREAARFLNQLHDYYDLSWPKIAQLPAINPPKEDKIPVSTLAKIAQTKKIPKKWRYKFPGIGAIDDRERIAIYKNDMERTRKTIFNHISPENREILARFILEDLRSAKK